MRLSLSNLKNYLITKGGYSINPSNRQLDDLLILLEDMMVQRAKPGPGVGEDSFSGTTCDGHVYVAPTRKSLGNIYELNIKDCSCNTVTDTTAYCLSRTGTTACECNSRTSSTCSCVSRTMCLCYSVSSCSCQSRTANLYYDDSCLCHDRTLSIDCTSRHHPNSSNCTCNTRTGTPIWTCTCYNRTGAPACQCLARTTPCSCYARDACTSDSYYNDCSSRTSCTSYTYYGSECGSRVAVPVCQCDARCACNVETKFS